MKLFGNTWKKNGGLLLLVETGQTWGIGHWSDEDFADFLEEDNQFCTLEMLVEKEK